MATYVNILSSRKKKQFETPPILQEHDRIIAFSLPPGLIKKVDSLRTPQSKIGFILQAGYFRITRRFFPVSTFRADDISYVAQSLGMVSSASLSESSYPSSTLLFHRKAILNYFQWSPYTKARHTIVDKIAWYATLQATPEKLFQMVLELCWEHRIEVPGYHSLSKEISLAISRLEMDVLEKMRFSTESDSLTPLLELIHNEQENTTQYNPKFLLTELQEFPHTIQAADISSGLTHFKRLKLIHNRSHHILKEVGITDTAVQYFAEWIRKADAIQVKRFRDKAKAALYLSAFVTDEVKLRGDILIDVFLKSMRNTENRAQKQVRNALYSSRKERENVAHSVLSWNKRCKSIVEEIQDAALANHLPHSEKIEKIVSLTIEYLSPTTSSGRSTTLAEPDFASLIFDSKSAFLQALEQQEARISKQFRPLLLALDFDTSDLDETLKTALIYFIENEGNLSEEAPLDFLSSHEQEAVRTEKGLNIKLLHVLFYQKIAMALRAGRLSLQSSYRYKSLKELLIPQTKWEEEKEQLLALSGLSRFSDLAAITTEIDSALNQHYKDVNKRIQDGENSYVRKRPSGGYSVATPRVGKKGEKFISGLLREEYVPVFQILKEVDDIVGFTGCFKHHAVRYSKLKPSQETLIAAIISQGCNIGSRRLVKISRGLDEQSLRGTIRWCFSRENVNNANDAIIDATNLLSLSQVYSDDNYLEHTSSDGRKVGVSIESLQARYSAKYFGKGQGVSVYSFIDQRQHVYSTDIISSSDREASHVLDGLLQSGEMKSLTHSTDTHGYSEVVFALTHLLGVFFAPRLAKIWKHSIYCTSSATYKNREQFCIPPRGVISRKKIEQEWDDILRLVATIKLDHATGSQILLRLNSYSKHPLYAALKEFGRIIKSLFILRYYDDVELRQQIQLLLNRGEASQRFSRSIFFDNAGEFTVRSLEQQKVINLCQTLIQNAIVHWNYLYVSQALTKITSPEELTRAVEMIRGSSVLAWGHVNMKGEYDFTTGTTVESRFNMPAILALMVHSDAVDE